MRPGNSGLPAYPTFPPVDSGPSTSSAFSPYAGYGAPNGPPRVQGYSASSAYVPGPPVPTQPPLAISSMGSESVTLVRIRMNDDYRIEPPVSLSTHARRQPWPGDSLPPSSPEQPVHACCPRVCCKLPAPQLASVRCCTQAARARQAGCSLRARGCTACSADTRVRCPGLWRGRSSVWWCQALFKHRGPPSTGQWQWWGTRARQREGVASTDRAATQPSHDLLRTRRGEQRGNRGAARRACLCARLSFSVSTPGLACQVKCAMTQRAHSAVRQR